MVSDLAFVLLVSCISSILASEFFSTRTGLHVRFSAIGMILTRILPGRCHRQGEISSQHREIENNGLLYQNGQKQQAGPYTR